jgi:hypothetical protein
MLKYLAGLILLLLSLSCGSAPTLPPAPTPPPVDNTETLCWKPPTEFVDNSVINVAAQATITTKLYRGLDHITWGTAFATVPNGGASWVGPLGVAPGGTIYVTGTATIPTEGVESAYAAYATWTVPYVAPKAPTSITITRP